MMGRPHKCPGCGSTSTVRKGTRITKTLGLRRRRLCKACGRRFTPTHQPLMPVSAADATPTDTALADTPLDAAAPGDPLLNGPHTDH